MNKRQNIAKSGKRCDPPTQVTDDHHPQTVESYKNRKPTTAACFGDRFPGQRLPPDGGSWRCQDQLGGVSDLRVTSPATSSTMISGPPPGPYRRPRRPLSRTLRVVLFLRFHHFRGIGAIESDGLTKKVRMFGEIGQAYESRDSRPGVPRGMKSEHGHERHIHIEESDLWCCSDTFDSWKASDKSVQARL